MATKKKIKEDLIQELIKLSRKSSTQTVLFHHRIAEKLGLNPTDHKCLDIIFEAKQITAGHLANLTGLTTGAITSVADRLEKAKYIERQYDENDRRKVYLVPNYDKAEGIGKIIQESLSDWFQLIQTYSNEELEVIVKYSKDSQKVFEQMSL